MKRSQRRLHPWIWLVVGVSSVLILWLGVTTRSGFVPVTDDSPVVRTGATP